MSSLNYETVARFAQQGGMVYFGVMFLAAFVYALWPKHREAFQDLARLPLEDDEDDHVGA